MTNKERSHAKHSAGTKRILVDIDETICFYEGERIYSKAVPNLDNIAAINELYKQGHKIIYWTARGSVSGINYYDETIQQLQDWGCLFHELWTGTTGEFKKPQYDLLIDDKAMRIEELTWEVLYKLQDW